MKIPTIDRVSENVTILHLDKVTIWYSYNTPVAFNGGRGLCVIQNYWSTTTGKLLNSLDGGDKKGRLTQEQFDAALQEALAQ